MNSEAIYKARGFMGVKQKSHWKRWTIFFLMFFVIAIGGMAKWLKLPVDFAVPLYDRASSFAESLAARASELKFGKSETLKTNETP